MVDSKFFAEYFSDILNTYGIDYDKYFKIYADEGELRKAIKQYGKSPKIFTSGIAEITSSSLTPIRDVSLNTYSLQITLFIDLALNGYNEEKESLNLIETRNIITNIIKDLNGKTILKKVNDINYKITLSMSYPGNGLKTSLGFISDCLPMYLNCSIAMFQDGINSNECYIKLNGEKVPFTNIVFTRARSAEQSTFKGDKNLKTIIESQGLSIDAVVPATNSKFSTMIMNDILNGSNSAINVEVYTPLARTMFIGTFGDTRASLDIATNVGYNISIVRAKEDILDYDSDWDIIKTMDIDTNISINSDSVVYWGDGTVESLKAGNYNHTYTDNKNNHTIRIFKG